MLTSSVPASVVTSASTPARSGTGTRTSHRSPALVSRDGRLARAVRACSSTDSSPSRSSSATIARTSASDASRPSSTSTIAVRFSAQMSGQMPGCPDAMRVMSRKPPAARRSSARCSVARSSAIRMSEAAVRCGTCDTTATSASWWSGASDTTSAPSSPITVPQRGEGAVVGGRGGGEHPHRAGEEVRVGAVDAVLLGARHRMPADEAGVADGVDDRRLHAADVGDDARGRSPARPWRRRPPLAPAWRGT